MSKTETTEDVPPKIFISYRWSSPEHEEWVLRLAVSLRESGIDAYLDKWHLKEGQDTLAFMESMVSDPAMKKVLLICDAGYVERADSREGGVGTEAQIISSKVYSDTGQDKFAAIVIDLDAAGEPLLPAYISTRLYFDMSTPDAEAVNFEKIVRWVFDEPFHALPSIGPKPIFDSKTYTTASPLFRIDNTRSPNYTTTRLTHDAEHILDSIFEESASFLQSLVNEYNGEDQVFAGIKATWPVSENLYRAMRQLISDPTPKNSDVIHAFFEKLLKRWDYHPSGSLYSTWDNDVFQYFAHDAFVSFVALAMEKKAFKFASEILAMPLYKPRAHERTGEAARYVNFRPYLESLEYRNKQLSLRRISLHADLLNEAHTHSVVSFTSFLEADLTLYIRGCISPQLDWYPISAVYLANTYGSLPTYIRATSANVYGQLQPLLLDQSPDNLRQMLAERTAKGERLRFDYTSVDLVRLVNAEQLSTNQ